jgi:hypothetical protein
MFKNRFLIVLGVLSLLLVAMVISFPLSNTPTSAERDPATDMARWQAMSEYYANQAEAQRLEGAQPYIIDSATRSHTAWAKAAEAEANMVDSATRSYIAQAKAVTCGVDATYGLDLDSATRSYIAWGLALKAKDDIRALCR